MVTIMPGRDRPILFKGEMVRAIIDGRKTQTRRLVTLPKRRSLKGEGMEWVKSIHQDGGGNWIAWSTDAPDIAEFTKKAYPNGEGFPCPYGIPGDRLWVREKWLQTESGDIVFWADCKDDDNFLIGDGENHNWKPSIFMRRAISRLTLEITDVRVERLQDITDDDCFAEGIAAAGDALGNPRAPYRDLWDAINGKRAPWISNPFVWVISFTRLDLASQEQAIVSDNGSESQ